jgi:hypothetical protein
LPAFPAAGPPAGEGTASGRVMLDGTSVELKHAYAAAQPGFFDKSKEGVRVLLSDRPLSETERTDVFELIHAGRDGTATVVEVVIDADQRPISGALYARRFEGQVSATGMHRFEPSAFTRERLAGRLFVDGVHEFHGVAWQYEASFNALIPRPPTAEQVAAEIASAPGLAATAWIAAVAAGDREALLRLLLPQAAARWGSAFDARLADARADLPSGSRVVALSRPTPDRAVATVNAIRAADGVLLESTLELAQDGGAWKIVR